METVNDHDQLLLTCEQWLSAKWVNKTPGLYSSSSQAKRTKDPVIIIDKITGGRVLGDTKEVEWNRKDPISPRKERKRRVDISSRSSRWERVLQTYPALENVLSELRRPDGDSLIDISNQTDFCRTSFFLSRGTDNRVLSRALFSSFFPSPRNDHAGWPLNEEKNSFSFCQVFTS